MRIGIFVHSQTGNTLSVAEQLERELSAAGHTVTTRHLKAVGQENPRDPATEIEAIPDLSGYEAIVFASPVQAFSLAQGMATGLKRIDSLQGKQVACLITQAFPFPWLGGNRAVRQMTELVEAKGGSVCGSGIVNWMKKTRDQQITSVVSGMCGLF